MSENNNEIFYTKDHLKVKITQGAKGARVEVTIDREDHDIDKAVEQAIEAYQQTIYGLKTKSLTVDVY